jgi:hypothetical protein
MSKSKPITFAILIGVVIVVIIIIIIITHHTLKGTNDKLRREERERFRLRAEAELFGKDVPANQYTDITDDRKKTLDIIYRQDKKVASSSAKSEDNQPPEPRKRREDFKKKGVKPFTQLETKKSFKAVKKNMELDEILSKQQIKQLEKNPPDNVAALVKSPFYNYNKQVTKLRDMLSVHDAVSEDFDPASIDQYGTFHTSNRLQTLWPGNRVSKSTNY